MTLSSDHDEHQLLSTETVDSFDADEVPRAIENGGVLEIETPTAASQSIEDLTLAEAISELFHAPSHTIQALRSVISTPHEKSKARAADADKQTARLKPVKRQPSESKTLSDAERIARQREIFLLSTRVVAFLLAIYGNWMMATDRAEATGLAGGLPFLLIAFGVWIAGDIFTSPPASTVENDLVVGEIDPLPDVDYPFFSREFDWLTLGLRTLGGALAVVMSLITLSATTNNRFTTGGVITWIASVGLWLIILAPREWGVLPLFNRIRDIRLPKGWTLAALVAIMVVGAVFRLSYLNSIPTEMTSDHVEKILDAQRILDGNPQVFFPNNGGREPIQFYLLAIISQLPGLGLNFFTLKFLTAIEGLICIPVLWWMGREIIGKDEPVLGNLVGLLIAALVAVSYWHTMLSRLGLRIVLTVIVTALLIIFMSRGIRYNRRADFIFAGLVLGVGVYAYQAVRMLPVVVIAGMLLAIVFALFRARRWEQISRYLVNLGVLVLFSFVVFVPMLGFARDYPEDFWRRTSGRLLGDDLIQATDENGQLITRNATIEERMGAFQQNFGILINNIRNALLMYNWKGDVAWITAVPNKPEFDILTGALLIVGVGAWGVRMVKRRDAADWLMPAALFIMLLPSALSIAYPIENPSATRTSGSLPEAYLFAALPLALVVMSLYRFAPNWKGKAAGGVLVGAVVLASGSANWNTYFVEFRDSYNNSSPAPYTEAGRFLRGFADSGGALGNAFMIAYPYWWDHRALGLEAGATDWPNGVVSRDSIPGFLKDSALRTDAYRLDPDKDLLFFYHSSDIETEALLQTWFPTGIKQLVTTYKPGADYMVYRVPKLGAEGLQSFEVATGVYTP
ncbi:MAG: glycosyltransferase family 39 protein [Chloroflexi bacterium]|nr:glycosyltransferase family 39 protein [Chloroflexota bacterium]MCC6896483.1 hypothetical protein [Anaerolineae bacterium]